MESAFSLFTRRRELSHPRCDELALHDQSPPARTLDRRDSQWVHLSLMMGQGKTRAKCLDWG
jgi:hypothetical protein